MSPRNRRIAKTLATGERTDRVARKFKLSKGRISQIRGELRRSWGHFHGEDTR
jgi:DNA-binding CsgD family transcriptional regulator